MFESAFVNQGARTARPYTVPLSVLLQISGVAVAVALPLFYIEPLPAIGPVTRTPALLVELVEPPRHAARANPVALPRPAKATLPPLTAPRRIPSTIELPPGDLSLPTVASATVEGAALAVGIPYTAPAPPAVPSPKPPAPVQAALPAGPVRPGGLVRPPRLLHEARPVYPPLARQARISGAVRLEAVIGKDGAVHSLRAISGHPLLVPAALEAARQWRYQPTLLNGEPVEVALTIDVNFTLSR